MEDAGGECGVGAPFGEHAADVLDAAGAARGDDRNRELVRQAGIDRIGIAGAMLTIILASILEEVGWKGYCEDSIGNYMNWFWESMIFGVLWSFWHFPLLFIKGTYQAGLMVNPVYVINFFVSGIPLGFIITWVYLASDRSILACMIFHLTVNFMQEKIAMTPETKCVETVVVTIAAAIIVLANKEMFFGTKHVGRLLDTLQVQKA